MDKIGIDFKLISAQIVNFLILFLLLRWLIYTPIMKMLEERKKKIDDSIKLAEKTKKDQEEIAGKIQTELAKARKEAQEILESGKTEAEKAKEEIKATAEKEAKYMISKAEDRIKSQKEEMIQDIKKETVTLVIATAEKIIGKKISSDEEKKLIRDALEETSRIK